MNRLCQKSGKRIMPVKVYFESKTHAEVVAYFVDEDAYNVCIEALEKYATAARMIVTESVHEYADTEEEKLMASLF